MNCKPVSSPIRRAISSSYLDKKKMLLDVWILGLICAMRKTNLTRLQVALQTGSVPKRAVRTLVDIRRRHYCDNANGGVCLVHVWSNLDEFVKNGDTHSYATWDARKLATVGRSLMKL